MKSFLFSIALLLLCSFSCLRSLRGVSFSKLHTGEETYASSDGLAVMKITRATTGYLSADIVNKSKEAFDVDLTLATQIVRWNERPISSARTNYEGCELDENKNCRTAKFTLMPGERKKVYWDIPLKDNGKFSLPILKNDTVIDNFVIMFEICPLFKPCEV